MVFVLRNTDGPNYTFFKTIPYGHLLVGVNEKLY